MNLFKRMTALILAGVLSLGLLTGCGNNGGASASGSTSAQPEGLDIEAIEDVCAYLTGFSADQVVATADGIEVTVGELLYWMCSTLDEMLSYYYYYYGVTDLPWDQTDESGETTFAQFVLQDALDFALMQRLVERKAREEGMTVRPEDMAAVQATLESMEADATAQGVSMETLLWEQGLTPELFRWNYECDYLYQAIADKNFGNELPSLEELRAEKEKEGFYRVKHILQATVDTATRMPLDEAAAAEKKTKAEDLLKQLKESEDPLALFDMLMVSHSEDPGLATNPDGYEFQTNTTVDPAFEAAALELEEGQISGIVEGVSGYHIILRLPLDVSQQRNEAMKEKMSGLVESWIEAAHVQMTEVFDGLDAKAFYDNLSEYRDAVIARLEADAAQKESDKQ